jgi:transposase
MDSMWKLAEAGTKLSFARVAEEQAMTQVAKCIIAAHKAGHSKAAIARIAGVSRQTVYTILETTKK